MNRASIDREDAVLIVLVLIPASVVGYSVWTVDDPNEIVVEGRELRTNPDRVFDRVEELRGLDVSPPEKIVISDTTDSVRVGDGFHHLMGVGGRTTISGRFAGDGVIEIYASDTVSSHRLHRILVHEYVHVIQSERGVFSYRGPAWDVPPTTDAGLAWRSAMEGAAVFVTDAYVGRYLDGVPNQSSRLASDYRASTGVERYSTARYHFGYRYVTRRVDSPRNVSEIYDHPPQTTEQLLHNDTPSEEPPARLSVRVARLNRSWTHAESDTMGELFIRVALANELPAERAAAAAAGWGNDRLLVFYHTRTAPDHVWILNRTYVWVLRGDDPAETEELRRAFRAYFDRRAAPVGTSKWRDRKYAFRLQPVADETTVVLAGEPVLIRNATVTGNRTSVNVSLP